MTKANLEERVKNLNRRMESRGSIIRYALEYSDRVGILRCHKDEVDQGLALDSVRYGTKAEMAEFLHAMMVALDDSVRTD